MIRVFVAGPSADLDRCERAVFAVRKFGMVTEDWVAKVRADRDAGLTDHDMTEALALSRANECIAGVERADVVLWLSGGKSEGASLEAGVCIANRIPFVISGPPHPLYRSKAALIADDDEEAIECLSGMALLPRFAGRLT
jgi:hypothetical protein